MEEPLSFEQKMENDRIQVKLRLRRQFSSPIWNMGGNLPRVDQFLIASFNGFLG